MRYLKTLVAMVVFIFSVMLNLSAESVFMKSGTILEGQIIRENDVAITLRSGEGIESRIPRKKILRILYHDDFKQAKYIGTKDGKVIRGYIVIESDEYYTVRKSLKRKKEMMLRKKDVLYVSTKKLILVEDKKGEEEKEESLVKENNPTKMQEGIRLGMRVQYILGYNIADTNVGHIGHTGGFNFYFHWKDIELEALYSPKWNKESYHIINLTATWLPFSFKDLKAGFILGYGYYEDNLAYYKYQSSTAIVSIADYHGLNYGFAFNYSHWLRFSVSFGLMIEAEIKHRLATEVGIYKGYDYYPISSMRTQLEYIFLKNYSVYFTYLFLRGDQEYYAGSGGSMPASYSHHLMFFSLGVSYRFIL